jgi:hypothetical protein
MIGSIMKLLRRIYGREVLKHHEAGCMYKVADGGGPRFKVQKNGNQDRKYYICVIERGMGKSLTIPNVNPTARPMSSIML